MEEEQKEEYGDGRMKEEEQKDEQKEELSGEVGGC